jgi:predicted glycosyltransferase
MGSRRRILVAPLNWGLGHATRCIPIINALLIHGFEPVIGSDGAALNLLKKEFPHLLCLKLPPYDIVYTSLIRQVPGIWKAIQAEKETVMSLVEVYDIKGIISDNRFGVYSRKVPSIYITHQLRVLSRSTSWITSALHRHMIRRFDVCWVPDMEKEPTFSGRMGHIAKPPIPIKYLGILSRFQKQEQPRTFDLLVLLSGPEPQRTFLESILMRELERFEGKVIFVRGKVEAVQTVTTRNHIKIYNFMLAAELEQAINGSALILARPGYTTIMDLARLRKKAFFIPTPGQYEQDYLAKRLKDKAIANSCDQVKFQLKLLHRQEGFTGFQADKARPDFKLLFRLFEGK